jgi:hypothetical protein
MGQCCSEQHTDEGQSGFKDNSNFHQTKAGSSLVPPQYENHAPVSNIPPSSDSPHAPTPYNEKVVQTLPQLPAEALKSDSMFPPFRPLPPRR